MKEGDFVFYQHRDRKAWLGPVKVFSVHNNSVFLFVNGSMKKIPRCNIQLWKSGESPDDSGTSTNNGSFENSPKVSFEEEDFSKDMEEKEVEEIERRRTRSMMAVERRELERDQISTFWLRMENKECYEDYAVYAVEVPTAEHK